MTPADATSQTAWDGCAPEDTARRYYDATTWIYRLAWGASFHFAPLRASESRSDAIRRYERRLARALEIGPASVCLDLGCGVGGPALTIASVTGARIVGVNSNLDQLRVLERRHRRSASRAHRGANVRGVGAEFDRLPFADDSFDRAYAFEALCHAVDLTAALREVHRVLRPGGMLGFSEWCMTDAFDPGREAHRRLHRAIETAYGVVRLRKWPEWHAALLDAGFRIVESADQAQSDDGEAGDHWSRGLLPRDRSLDSFARRPAVRALQARVLAVAERFGVAPRGTGATVRRLREGTAALVEAGSAGVFTPMMLVIAVKDAR